MQHLSVHITLPWSGESLHTRPGLARSHLDTSAIIWKNLHDICFREYIFNSNKANFSTRVKCSGITNNYIQHPRKQFYPK